MPRRAEITPRVLPADSVHSSTLVSQVINRVMVGGKKSTAELIVYAALAKVEERSGRPALEVLEQAIKSVTPSLEVRSRRVGGANYQVPMQVNKRRQQSLAFRWILAACRDAGGRPMHMRLADELVAAFKKEGKAMSTREQTHRMADANKAFAHFAW